MFRQFYRETGVIMDDVIEKVVSDWAFGLAGCATGEFVSKFNQNDLVTRLKKAVAETQTGGRPDTDKQSCVPTGHAG